MSYMLSIFPKKMTAQTNLDVYEDWPSLVAKLSKPVSSEDKSLIPYFFIGQYANNTHKKINVIREDALTLDIDSGLPYSEALKLMRLKQINFLMFTTYTHNLPKDGKPAEDRYRVVIPYKQRVTDERHHLAIFDHFYEYLNKAPDANAKTYGSKMGWFRANEFARTDHEVSLEFFDPQTIEPKPNYQKVTTRDVVRDEDFPQVSRLAVCSMLEVISPDQPYAIWRDIGYALHNNFYTSDEDEEFGRLLYDEWSQGSDSYRATAIGIYDGYDHSRVDKKTMGYLVTLARANGWKSSKVTHDSPLAIRLRALGFKVEDNNQEEVAPFTDVSEEIGKQSLPNEEVQAPETTDSKSKDYLRMLKTSFLTKPMLSNETICNAILDSIVYDASDGTLISTVSNSAYPTMVKKKLLEDEIYSNMFFLEGSKTPVKLFTYLQHTTGRAIRTVNARVTESSRKYGEVFERGGKLYVNIWNGLLIEPKPSKTYTDEYHLKWLQTIMPDDYSRLIRWCAFFVQNCASLKISHAPLIYGGQGSGKSMIMGLMRSLLGDWLTTVARDDDLKSRFNTFLVGQLLIIVNEVKASEGHNSTEIADRLKEPIADHAIRAEGKGRDSELIPIKCSWMLATNHKDAIKLAWDDRRFLLIRAPTGGKAYPVEFQQFLKMIYNTILLQDSGSYDKEKSLEFRASFLDFLLRYDTTGFNPTIPENTQDVKDFFYEARVTNNGLEINRMLEETGLGFEPFLVFRDVDYQMNRKGGRRSMGTKAITNGLSDLGYFQFANKELNRVPLKKLEPNIGTHDRERLSFWINGEHYDSTKCNQASYSDEIRDTFITWYQTKRPLINPEHLFDELRSSF